MYVDPNTPTQAMYEDMSCSCYCGCPDDDFPDDVKTERDSVIRYQYNVGSCYFTIDGIVVEVLDCREMRKNPEVHTERYADVCVSAISYIDEDGNCMYHIILNVWLYGSTGKDFNENAEVQPEFIEAARKYIEEHHITKEMQHVD